MDASNKVPGMKSICLLFPIILLSLIISPAIAKESRQDKQASLDSTCEVARQKELAPMRAKFVDDCVANKELPGRDECVTFYADYGNRMGGRAPLFYDLPECVTAFEFNQSSA